MAKKKIKKPVSKRVAKTPRTTRATLEQRNELLGQDAPKTRKPRTKKPKVVTTTEPAIETVWKTGSAEEFLADTAASGPVFIPNHPEQRVEFTKVHVPSRLDSMDDTKTETWTSAIKELHGDISQWFSEVGERPIEKLKEFAFEHPLTFAITFCTALTGVAIAVAAVMRYFRW